jgi:hypothetical protein
LIGWLDWLASCGDSGRLNLHQLRAATANTTDRLGAFEKILLAASRPSGHRFRHLSLRFLLGIHKDVSCSPVSMVFGRADGKMDAVTYLIETAYFPNTYIYLLRNGNG